ncbi:Bgt-50359 [Blumeria graminis f. sp. tritici]|uniref:Bgt-50359 n=1 Tax=Blumeria graminis f. sp. tritici TaxID=62690 RepID=A0A9X9L9N9_BLUGR|nr:Bgt-50359 [Blumeria graminis f. sp. tritici]
MRNGPNTDETLQLPLQSEVRVYREKEKWTGPFTLLATDGQTCKVEINGKLVKFRSTCIKKYLRNDTQDVSVVQEKESLIESGPILNIASDYPHQNDKSTVIETVCTKDKDIQPPGRVHTRPKRSCNKVYLIDNNNSDNCDEKFVQDGEISNNDSLDAQFFNDNHVHSLHSMTFVSNKEQADRELSLNLRREGRITAPGKPFEESDIIELESLCNQEVMKFITYDPNKHMGRILNQEWFEKSRVKQLVHHMRSQDWKYKGITTKVRLQFSARLQQFNVQANKSCLQLLHHCALWAFIFG